MLDINLLDDLMMPRTVASMFKAPTTLASKKQPMNIWLIEDTISDALLARFSMDATKIPYQLTTLHRGYQLMQHLDNKNKAKPDVIILDLGLPDMDGFEILAHLAEVKASIKAIPIVILTGQKHFEYIQSAYPLSIFAYVNKPCNDEDMREVLLRIQSYQSCANA